MPTAEQQNLIDAIAAALQADARVEAAWLAGSLGRGEGDAFSDVDVLALVGEAPVPEVSTAIVKHLSEIAPPALVMPLFGGAVLSVVTEEWARFDISVIGPDFLVRYDVADLKPLFNRTGREPPRRERQPYSATPERVLELSNEFIRVLGLLTVVVGRGGWIMAQSGVDILRRSVIDLMVEANGVHPADRGGVKNLERLLTPNQAAALLALPAVGPDRDSIIQAHEKLARIFLPLGRAVAVEVGAEWPEAFEAATRRHLKARLGMDI